MCPLAEGTGPGGSLRGPAASCGAVGFGTTPGLIPRYPSVLAWDTYSVEGPKARTIADTALMLSVVAGPHHPSPPSFHLHPRAIAEGAQAPAGDGVRVAPAAPLGGGHATYRP